jgi:hypothetical protein
MDFVAAAQKGLADFNFVLHFLFHFSSTARCDSLQGKVRVVHWAFFESPGTLSVLAPPAWALHHRMALLVDASCHAVELVTALLPAVTAIPAANLSRAATTLSQVVSLMSSALSSAPCASLC